MKKNKKILIVYNSKNCKAKDFTNVLDNYCAEFGFDCHIIRNTFLEDANLNYANYVLICVCGGDGTILHTAKHVISKNIPILGFNFGHLGFLTNSGVKDLKMLLKDALEGKLKKEIHHCLEIEISTEKNQYNLQAINELWIKTKNFSRLENYVLNINNCDVCDLRSDGMIVSSATGSSAYALSVGGPFINPTFDGMIIAPIAAHTLKSRPILTSASDVITFDLSKFSDNVYINIDGDEFVSNENILKVKTYMKGNNFTLLRDSDYSFYKQISSIFFK